MSKKGVEFELKKILMFFLVTLENGRPNVYRISNFDKIIRSRQR